MAFNFLFKNQVQGSDSRNFLGNLTKIFYLRKIIWKHRAKH